MATTEIPEKPAAQLMRQNYQAKVGERLLQAGMMAKGRALAMWNARKMINGTLGEPDPPGEASPEDEAMQIRVGDEVHHHHPPSESSKPAGNLSKLALGAALAMGTGGLGIGAAIPLVLDALKPPPPPIKAPVDTDTRNTFTLS